MGAAQSLIEDAKHAALSGIMRGEAMHAAAGRVLVGSTARPRAVDSEIGKDTGHIRLGGSAGKEDMIENYRSTIGRVRMDWPYLLLRAEGELDVMHASAARKQAAA